MSRVGHPSVPEPPRPGMFSNARVFGRHFFVSGMHAGTPDGPVGGGDVYRQAREAFRRTRVLVEACGAQVDDILALRIYVTDIADKAAVGRARAEVFHGDFPCSTLVEVSALVEAGLGVEVEAQGIISATATADA
ncbi:MULTISPECIES: RidA family protein [Rhodococcus]|uniref:RidA family protein n=1 Tax=Rhodococcus TaxID=1827 RepID=UPI00065FB82C|nr:MULTISPECIES: RidA family protein [Rhodococcus]MBD8055024.1 RidA family protein [Rhodococcus ruber]MCF8785215.1 RidA family protein [Rhodococcus ruber]MDV3207999.1 RidA family protein [Rhodococcus ruber]UIR35564.1 RidA family protein [Rhodococcus sp. DMF-1]